MSEATEKPKKEYIKLNQYDRQGKGRELVAVLTVTKREAEIIMANPAQAKIHAYNDGETVGEPQMRKEDNSIELEALKGDFEEALNANANLKAFADAETAKAQEAMIESDLLRKAGQDAIAEADAAKAENDVLKAELEALKAANAEKPKGKKGNENEAANASNGQN